MTLSARKQIPAISAQLLADLGLPDDDTQQIIIAAALVEFHKLVDAEAEERYATPKHEPDCPAYGVSITPDCTCRAETTRRQRVERRSR